MAASNYALKQQGSPAIEISTPFTIGTYRVWQRNVQVFFRLWKTELWPAFVEAILTLVAFGFGLGVYVNQGINGQTYLQFIAPGLVFSSVLFTSCFECMFGTYIRMKIERIFDAMIATPVSINDVVAGEIVWAASRAGLTGSSVLIVLAVLGLTPSWWVLLIPFVAFIGGFMLASMTMIVTALVPSINSFNYFITLGVIPMQLFGGIFFPVTQLPDSFRWIIYLFPLYPVVQLGRNLFAGSLGLESLLYVAWIVGLAVVFYTIATNLMRHRLIK